MTADIIKFPRKPKLQIVMPSDLMLAQSCAAAASQALIDYAANPIGLNDPMKQVRAIANLFTGDE